MANQADNIVPVCLRRLDGKLGRMSDGRAPIVLMSLDRIGSRPDPVELPH